MVELFYVRVKHHRANLDSDLGLQYRFHGRYGVNVSHCILGQTLMLLYPVLGVASSS